MSFLEWLFDALFLRLEQGVNGVQYQQGRVVRVADEHAVENGIESSRSGGMMELARQANR